MKTSTLQKLPVPFMAACGLGLGMVGFLLLGRSSDTTSKQASQQQAASQQVPVQQPAEAIDESLPASDEVAGKRGTRNTAKLNRPGGDNYRPVSKAGARVVQAPSHPRVYSPSNSERISESSPSDMVVRGKPRAPRVAGAPARRARKPFAARPVGVQASSNLSSPAAPKYSPQETDPSQVLSDALTEAEKPGSEPADIVVPDSVPVEDASKKITLEPQKDNSPSGAGVAKAKREKSESGTEEKLQNSVLDPDAPTETAVEDQGSLETKSRDNVVAGQLTPEESQKSEVVIQNPSANELPVWFMVKQRKVRLEPGQKFVFWATEAVPVRFSRGGEYGVAKVKVFDGTWRFSVSRAEGWRLNEL